MRIPSKEAVSLLAFATLLLDHSLLLYTQHQNALPSLGRRLFSCTSRGGVFFYHLSESLIAPLLPSPTRHVVNRSTFPYTLPFLPPHIPFLYTMMDFQDFWADLCSQFEGPKFVRLVAIVGGYMLIRSLFMTHLKNKQLADRVAADKQEKAEGLIDRPDLLASAEASANEPLEFGWGKKTRRNLKIQKEIFEKTLDDLASRANLNDDDDKDIADLLE